MKIFIVPTDFSQEAENALEYACAAAKNIGAKVVVFNSYSFPIHASNARLPASSMRDLEEQNKKILENRTKQLSQNYGIEVDYEYGLMTEVTEELDNLMVKYKGDAVIMGMAPRSLAQDLFGNTTTSVILKQKYPVLAVPLGSTYKGFRRILFACDNPRDVPQHILAKIREIASALDAEVEIFHVQAKVDKISHNERAVPNPSTVEEGLEGITYYYKDVESGAVIKEIEKEVKILEADLLIMMPKKYGFWDSLIHRSKTRIMASNNAVPLLSIPL